MKAFAYSTAWFLFFLLAASSCLEEPDCFALNNNLVGISFKKLSDGRADTLFMSRITAESSDSVFLNNLPGTLSIVTGLLLPVNFLRDETNYQFETVRGAFDLQLDYNARPQFVSVDCGERFVVSDLRGFSETFDSVRVVSSDPGRENASGTNIEIYRCPNRSQLKLRFTSPVELQNVELLGDYSDDLFFAAGQITTLRLPLDINAEQSTIRLTFVDGNVYVLTVGYTAVRQQLFSACGEEVYLEDLEVLEHSFPLEPVLLDSTFSDPPRTHLEIAF